MTMTSTLQKRAILVSSCDSYSDAWPLFFHFYFKYCGACDLPVYLLANHKSYQDARVKMLNVGDDVSWTDGISKALQQMDATHLLFLQDDFLLNQPLDFTEFQKVFDQFISVGGLSLEIDLRSDQGPDVPTTWLRQSNAQNLHSGLNATLWRKDFLEEIASVAGLNIWQAETRIRDCLRQGRRGLYFLKKETPPILSYVESIKGGFWQPAAIEFLKSQGLKPDLQKRPCPPQGKGLIPKLIRSYLKKRMRRQNKSAPLALEVFPLSHPA